jgi:YD repeat-containing protein
MDMTDTITSSAPTAVHRATARALTDCMREFLAAHQHLVLATTNPDGTVHAVPYLYTFDGTGFLVATTSAGRTGRNIAARPNATVTVDDREAVGWVSGSGPARLVRGPEARALNERIYRTWMTEEGVAVVGRALAEVEDITIVVTPVRWRAWDMASTVVPYLVEAGIPMDQPGRWFR